MVNLNNTFSSPAEEPPRIFTHADLPGPMSAVALNSMGLFKPLTRTDGYLPCHARTAASRARMMDPYIPYSAVVCLWLAAWVWAGGTFPPTIDIISATRYRAPQLSRTVRVFNRKLTDGQTIVIGHLLVTSPVRTACDLACLEEELDETRRAIAIRSVLVAGRATPSDCLRMLYTNRRWPGFSQGARILTRMDTALYHAHKREAALYAAARRREEGR